MEQLQERCEALARAGWGPKNVLCSCYVVGVIAECTARGDSRDACRRPPPPTSMPRLGVLCRGEKPCTGQSVYRPTVSPTETGVTDSSSQTCDVRFLFQGLVHEQTRNLTALHKMAQRLCCFKGPAVEGQRGGCVCTFLLFTAARCQQRPQWAWLGDDCC